MSLYYQDGKTMQLVPRDIHTKTGHDGGFSGG
ncbi:HNH endonuclease [Marinagarivorans algicola]